MAHVVGGFGKPLVWSESLLFRAGSSTAGDGIGNLLGLERKVFVDRFFDDGPEMPV
ncbi:MAG: hypothetical protein VX694_17220 [Planctomycetota bacterium]|nr:hypothetical protein [Planctomycetota bacterium]